MINPTTILVFNFKQWLQKLRHPGLKKERFRVTALLILVVLALLPSDGLGFSACLFNRIFGIPCPACGLTRSLSSLLNFEWSKSIAYHPLGGLVLFLLFLLLLTNRPDYLKMKLGRTEKAGKIIFSFPFLMGLFLIVWIIRIA